MGVSAGRGRANVTAPQTRSPRISPASAIPPSPNPGRRPEVEGGGGCGGCEEAGIRGDCEGGTREGGGGGTGGGGTGGEGTGEGGTGGGGGGRGMGRGSRGSAFSSEGLGRRGARQGPGRKNPGEERAKDG
jgi:hypothetical protein